MKKDSKGTGTGVVFELSPVLTDKRLAALRRRADKGLAPILPGERVALRRANADALEVLAHVVEVASAPIEA
jgi:hypothetical protein